MKIRSAIRIVQNVPDLSVFAADEIWRSVAFINNGRQRRGSDSTVGHGEGMGSWGGRWRDTGERRRKLEQYRAVVSYFRIDQLPLSRVCSAYERLSMNSNKPGSPKKTPTTPISHADVLRSAAVLQQDGNAIGMCGKRRRHDSCSSLPLSLSLDQQDFNHFLDKVDSTNVCLVLAFGIESKENTTFAWTSLHQRRYNPTVFDVETVCICMFLNNVLCFYMSICYLQFH